MKIVDIKAYPTSFRVPKDQQVSLGIGTMTKRDCVMVKVTTETASSAGARAITPARRHDRPSGQHHPARPGARHGRLGHVGIWARSTGCSSAAMARVPRRRWR
jgi:hypothetical protein